MAKEIMTRERLQKAQTLYNEKENLRILYELGLSAIFDKGKSSLSVKINLQGPDGIIHLMQLTPHMINFLEKQSEMVLKNLVKEITKEYNKKQKEFERA